MTDTAGRQLAQELRELVDTIVSTQPDEDVLNSLIDDIASARARLDGLGRTRYWERGEGGEGFMRWSPFRGSHNPMAPPMSIELIDDDEDRFLTATVTVGSVGEGPPSCVHGGIIAGLHDEICGAASSRLAVRPGGMTGRLEVRYRAPTPINSPLRFDARLTADRGRRVMVASTCYSGDLRCSDAVAMFVRPAPGVTR